MADETPAGGTSDGVAVADETDADPPVADETDADAAAVEIDGVSKRYGDVVALDDVSLTVTEGTTYGLLGTNGAGKTTLFSLLVGHQRPDTGRLRVAGADPANGTDVRRRVGYLPESAGFPPSFSGREVLAFHADVRGAPESRRESRIDEVLATVGLADAADRRVGGYSKGMNRRLGLATALLDEPTVLLLDEPTAGLDPRGVDAFNDVVADLAAADGMTILFSSHALAEVETLCDELAILGDGEVRAAGRVDELRAAAADAVTVTATLAESGETETVCDALRDRPGVRQATPTRRGGIHLTCDRSAAADVVAALHDATAVERFEVREPGLEAAFRDALAGVDGAGEVPGRDGAGEATGGDGAGEAEGGDLADRHHVATDGGGPR